MNSDTGECLLSGFGLASRLARERQVPDPPESIAGTLAYMAPEQTGWMNRSIDSRSDLYSLGVTFYQMRNPWLDKIQGITLLYFVYFFFRFSVASLIFFDLVAEGAATQTLEFADEVPASRYFAILAPPVFAL